MPDDLLFCDRPRLQMGVVVVGSTTIDRNLISTRRHLRLGGVTAYAGRTYRRHGLPTWVVTNVASADSAILTPLREEGIQVLRGDSPRTTRFVNRIGRHGRRQQVLSLAAPLQQRQLRAVLAQVEMVHLGPLHPEDIAAEVYEGLATRRPRVILDLQGLVRRISGRRIQEAVSPHHEAALQAADVVKASAAEVQTLLAEHGSELGALMARFPAREWIITNGSAGGCIYARDGGSCPYPADPVSSPVDPTGAGDVFLAAYAAARFAQGLPVTAASRQAAHAAAELVAGRYLSPALIDYGGPPAGLNCVDNTSQEG